MLSFQRSSLFLVLAACGGGIANPSQGTPGRGAPGQGPDSGIVGSPTSPQPPSYSCSLTFTGAEKSISPSGGGGSLGSMAADGDHLLIGAYFGNANPTPTQTESEFAVVEVSFDGTLLASNVNLLPTIGAVAAGSGHAGAFGGIPDCSFLALGPDGAPLGQPTLVAQSSVCRPVIATPSGYATLTAPAALNGGDQPNFTNLVMTDATGAVTFSGPLASSTGNLLAIALLPDGTLLVAESDLGTLYVHHVDPTGQALAPRQQVSAYYYGSVAMATLGGGALVAVVTGATPNALFSVQALDGDGAPVGAPASLGDLANASVVALDIAALGGTDDAVVAWGVHVNEEGGGTYIFAQAVSAGGAVVSPPFQVPYDEGSSVDVGVVSTPKGALLAWDGFDLTAVPLVCSP